MYGWGSVGLFQVCWRVGGRGPIHGGPVVTPKKGPLSKYGGISPKYYTRRIVKPEGPSTQMSGAKYLYMFGYLD